MGKFKYVIIGNGICGSTAAEILRAKESQSTIAVVDEENKPLYSRVLLPAYVKGTIKRENVFLKTESFWRDNNIEFLGGKSVVKLDDEKRKVILSDDSEISFEKVFVASGGDVKRSDLPGQDLEGVHYLRTIDDADSIIKTIERIKKSPENKRKIVILGGSFIGLELASCFAVHGIGGIIVIRRPYYWADKLDKVSSSLLASTIENNGFKIISSSGIDHISGEEKVEGVKIISGETYECAGVGMGLGIDLNTDFLEESHVKVSDGIETDEYLETSVPGIYAGGDVAKFMNPIIGRKMRFGNWTNSIFQGRLAAENMLGGRHAVDFISGYGATYFGVPVSFVGDVSGEDGAQIVQRGESGWQEQLFVRNNFIIGATLINVPKDRMTLTSLIKNKVKFKDIGVLADASQNLASYING